MNATNNNETRNIKVRTMGITFFIVVNAEYNIAKRNNGWAVTKNGEFVDDYYYMTKYAAASRIPGCKYVEC